MHRDKITDFLKKLLKPELFKDYAPNGLQVEGKEEVKKLITGVTGCVELFQNAIEKQADGILVHHGIIWNFERPVYKGAYRQRVKLLLENDINLWGFHLPVDAHEKYGNNALLAEFFELQEIESFGEYNGSKIGMKGKAKVSEPEYYFAKVKKELNPNAVILPYGKQKIQTIGIISGGAQKEFGQAVDENIDLYITGEISEYNLHMAKEEKVHFIAAGHHVTERFGVRRIGELLQQELGLIVEFVDIPNPA
ncbi:MAG: Nif3-like dinuclear metal center hexameric protein [Candidatus Marinimicrobia bacterium]|nr:Nif3-like dinuclear metal center hexameric protein [Candidatus Neomarinimicrobiota bacterium]